MRRKLVQKENPEPTNSSILSAVLHDMAGLIDFRADATGGRWVVVEEKSEPCCLLCPLSSQ